MYEPANKEAKKSTTDWKKVTNKMIRE